MTILAATDWGSVPAWVSALTPLVLAGVLTRALDRTTQTIRESLRPRSLRERLRVLAQPQPRPDRTTPHPPPDHPAQGAHPAGDTIHHTGTHTAGHGGDHGGDSS